MINQLQIWARRFKTDITALSLAARDRRTPWYAKLVLLCVVGYAFSPIDLIPDPIPVLGYLDDLILLPLGIAFAIKLVPQEVMTDCRLAAASGERSVSRLGAAIVVGLWLLLALAGFLLVRSWLA
jgi:uncharacterized membrane protein YkvA (DUF1232 family)